MSSPLLLFISILPGALLLFQVRRLDRLEPEPTGLIVKLLIAGAFSTVPAMVLESLSGLSTGLLFCLVVGFSEEASKYFAAKLLTWKNPEFNCTYDGVVYCAATAIGFAVLENIGYVMMFGTATAVVRFFTAVPAHTAMGILMGISYGRAKEADIRGTGSVKKLLWTAVCVPALFHALYDYTAEGCISILWFFAAMWLIYRLILKDSRKAAAADHYFEADMTADTEGEFGTDNGNENG